MAISQQPILYIPHGGGPLPLLEDPGHASLTAFLRELGESLEMPDGILVISAHWEAPLPTIQATAQPDMLFDYYGFPPESYEFEYPAPGHPALAVHLRAMLQAAGIEAAADNERGFDHGVFVPLLLMFPGYRIPTLQLSLIQGLDAGQHLALGEAIQRLREQNILVLGSGMTFHNLPALLSNIRAGNGADTDNRGSADAAAFSVWLRRTCCDEDFDAMERRQRLANWSRVPGARFSQPREEHLLPLHVCAGAAGYEQAQLIFAESLMGFEVLGMRWD